MEESGKFKTTANKNLVMICAAALQPDTRTICRRDSATKRRTALEPLSVVGDITHARRAATPSDVRRNRFTRFRRRVARWRAVM